MISSCGTSELTDEKKDSQTSASQHCPSCGHSLDCNPVYMLLNAREALISILNSIQQQFDSLF
jgi:uncharacterized protein (UPF0212 family)